MTSEPQGPRFTARLHGVEVEQLVTNGMDVVNLVNGVDIYLRAGCRPEIILRPVVEGLTVDLLTSPTGTSPRLILAPDIAHLMSEVLGWKSPGDVVTLEEERDRARAEVERLEVSVEALADRAARLEESLATAHGRIQDLELEARGTAEETTHRRPYDTAGH